MIALRPLVLSLPLVVAPIAGGAPTPSHDVTDRATVASPAVAPARESAFMGPPWISIEHPVNPYDASTKHAFLVVHAFHHGTPTGFPVTGTAEGLVNGERRSIPLRFTTTSRTGVFALAKQWPDEGTWTLVVSVAQGPDDKVSAIVDLARGGEVASVRVPTRQRDGHTLPAAVAMAEVDASLRQRAARVE